MVRIVLVCRKHSRIIRDLLSSSATNLLLMKVTEAGGVLLENRRESWWWANTGSPLDSHGFAKSRDGENTVSGAVM
jgi:hypothetical protein